MNLSEYFLSFCKEREAIDTHSLALQGTKYPDINISEAIQQIKGLQIAKSKLPTFYKRDRIGYPPHLSLEQCSSETTALYKAKIAGEGQSMVDLTGGFGIDFFFMSRFFNQATYIERQTELYQLVSYNLKVLESENTKTFNIDAVDYLNKMEKVHLIYIDPARRSDIGRKTVLIEDCTPNLLEIEELLIAKASKVMIKLSPMLDISLAIQQLKNITEVHVVSVNNECKELLLIQNNEIKVDHTDPIYHCINIKNNKEEYFEFSKQKEIQAESNYTNHLEEYLYEPNASIMKGGAYNLLAQRFNLLKLHPNSHLYTSSTLIKEFPGRKFKAKTVFTLNKKEVKEVLTNISEANVITRNFPLKPEELKKRLKIKDGGNSFIFGTTLYDNKHVLILSERV